MAKESTYKITITGVALRTVPIINQLAAHRNVNFVTADNMIVGLLDLLREPITESQKDRTLRFFGHIGYRPENYTLVRVKRKYVRKGQEPVIPNQVPIITESPDTIGIEQPIDMQGLLVPIGTVVTMSRKGEGRGTQYRIISFCEGSPGWCRLQCLQFGTYTPHQANHEPRYQVSIINRSLKNKAWHLRTETPELLAKIETYTNVIRYQDFKRSDTYRTDPQNNRVQASNPSYIIDIDGNRMPVTPGFTGNCQLTVIGNMVNLVNVSSDLKAQLKEIHYVTGRKLLLCDVNKYVVKQLQEKLPKTWFHSIMPYTSTNKSEMALCLINISKR